MQRKVLMISYASLFLLSCVSISIAQAQSPQQVLNQYVSRPPKDPQRLRPEGKDHPARADDEAEARGT